MRQAMITQNSKTLAKFLLVGKRPEGKPDALKGARPVWGEGQRNVASLTG